MFRPFIGSSSGLLLNQVSECCVHVGIPTMVTNNRNITCLTIELHKTDVIVWNVHVCVYIYIVYMCVYIYTYTIYTHIYTIHIHTHAHTNKYICIYMCVCGVCVCVCACTIKAIPLQAWTSREGSRRLRIPDLYIYIVRAFQVVHSSGLQRGGYEICCKMAVVWLNVLRKPRLGISVHGPK